MKTEISENLAKGDGPHGFGPSRETVHVVLPSQIPYLICTLCILR